MKGEIPMNVDLGNLKIGPDDIVNIHTGEITMDPEEAKKLIQNVDFNEASQPPKMSGDNLEEPPIDKKEEKAIKRELRNKDNKFNEIIGPGYSSRFAEIQEASLTERFAYMATTVSFADQDGIKPAKKKLVHDLEDAFYDACCIEGPSERLMGIINKKPNLTKLIQDNRINRVYEDLWLAPVRLGFSSLPTGKYLPTFFTTMAFCYGWKNIKHDQAYNQLTGKKNITGTLLAALLSKYARGLSPYDYAGMWFVLMFMKNLSVCSITQKSVIEEHPELQTYANNLFILVDHMLEVCNPEVLEAESPKNEPVPLIQLPKEDNVTEIE